jgi:surface carbohydrate biosynthesis protein
MKILILTASPIRDKLIDELIADELRARGHEVWIRPCLREGRKACLELQPDVVVVPPIRNPYSRDFVETIKYHGAGVVSRHTEASCDWQDFKKMLPHERSDILGRFPYIVDCELVWGEDEAQILTQRKCPFPVIPIGAFGLDIYKQDLTRFGTKEVFRQKYNFTKEKILVIACPWGFADSAPDLNIDDTVKARKDIEGRTRHISMIKTLKEKLPDWDILVTLHPGVLPDEYRKELDVPIDTDRSSAELLVHCDALIHSGSTMAMEMHMLDKPAFQYGDVNQKLTAGWWLKTGTPLSKISPEFEDIDKLAEAIRDCSAGSNANLDAIKELENGRYGKMDGSAYKRAADEIEKIKGKWENKWDRPIRDYDQPVCVKHQESVIQKGRCGICGEEYTIVQKDWLTKLLKNFGVPDEKIDPLYNVSCPNCCSKFYLQWQQ